ncbi:hypothetical protein L218DRAFT_966586 [Marasmius fiardii PR-910]|nr:hypothetical protein L218DRAFT_966586 [Marasmius fiardii PR-910]
MYSLSRKIKALKKFYEQPPFHHLKPFDPKNQTQAKRPHPHNYPYPNTYKAHDSNASIMFTYERALQPTYPCVTFLAKENVSKDLVVVKFVDQTSYGTVVHQFLADQGMYMVVMDYIECGTQPLAAGADDAGRQVGYILNLLHEEGYVFGDLHDPNIIFNDGKAMLVDFDWTGKFDQASPTSRSSDCTDITRYPYQLNEHQSWPLAPARDLGGMPILPGDDDFMLKKWVEWLKGKKD